jgi:hypothetical protein
MSKHPIDKLKQWKEGMFFKLPLIGGEGHFTQWDLDRLSDIIQEIEDWYTQIGTRDK